MVHTFIAKSPRVEVIEFAALENGQETAQRGFILAGKVLDYDTFLELFAPATGCDGSIGRRSSRRFGDLEFKRTDTERLNWLGTNSVSIERTYDGVWRVCSIEDHENRDLRVAIDAAMEADRT